MRYLLILLLLIGLLNSCSEESQNDLNPILDSTLVSNDSSDIDDPISSDTTITSTTYIVTFEGTWTANSHPVDYPRNTHFSGVIGMTHQEGAVLFEENTPASDGIKVMAETGGKTPLIDEINNIINSRNADQLISEGGLATGTSKIEFEVTVYSNNSHITLVSMIAPSPDWFVAVENLDLYENGNWIEDITITPIHYDAGTDSGVTFNSRNSPSVPQENVYTIKDAPLGDGQNVSPAVAIFRFRKK